MQSSIYAISHNLSQPLTEQTYILAAAAFLMGALLSWLVCSGSKKAATAKFHAEITAEKNRVNETKQRLASTQQDLLIHRDSEAALKQEQTILIAKITAEQKALAEKELTLQDAQTKLGDTFKTLSSDALRSNQEQFLQLAKTSLSTQQQTAEQDLDARKHAVEQMINPITNTLVNLEQRINGLAELEKSREGAYASLKEQLKHIASTQLVLQKETSQVVKSLQLVQQTQKLQEERSIILTNEALRPLDPLDSFVDDGDANDFSTEALDDDFEGFTAETPGEGI